MGLVPKVLGTLFIDLQKQKPRWVTPGFVSSRLKKSDYSLNTPVLTHESTLLPSPPRYASERNDDQAFAVVFVEQVVVSVLKVFMLIQ